MENQVYTVVVVLKIKDGQQAYVKQSLLSLKSIVTREEGCISCSVYQDEEPDTFIIHEHWENKDVWLKHMSATHMSKFSEMAQAVTNDIQLYKLSEINVPTFE